MQLLAISLLAGLFVPTLTEGVGNNALGNLDEKDVMGEFLKESSASGNDDPRLGQIRQMLSSMYAALPKNSQGKLSRQAAQYALHRFFVHSRGWFIRGLEPSSGEDTSSHMSKDMREWVPSYIYDLFEKENHWEGTDLDGLVVLAATLEDIVRLEAHERLKTIFLKSSIEEGSKLTREQAFDHITTYYVEFLRSNDLEYHRLAGLDNDVGNVLASKEEFIQGLPRWPEDLPWLEGLITEAASQQNGTEQFDFQSLKRVVNAIGDQYHTRNDRECKQLKETLHGMESNRPGRVRLGHFYGSAPTGWAFGEKKEYLRTLGLLDESDPKQPYVVITNYLTSRHNCFAPSDVYVICCRSQCEDLMSHLEGEIGAATATPSRIASLVANLPSASVAAPRQLSMELLTRLSQVAELHGGAVPLHGRLFAQWMHHAYPLECVFPHKEGTINPQTPSEWLKQTGQEMQASEEELLQHIADDGCAAFAAGGADCAEDVSLPWDSEEKLLTGAMEGTLPSKSRQRHTWARACVAAVVVVCIWLHSSCKEDGGEKSLHLRVQAAGRPPVLLGLLFAAVYIAGLLNDGLVLSVLIFSCAYVGLQKVSGRRDAGNPKDLLEDKLV